MEDERRFENTSANMNPLFTIKTSRSAEGMILNIHNHRDVQN